MIKHLYVHIPFCASICYYCDFARSIYNEKNVDLYLTQLNNQLKDEKINSFQETIYIGGGTPTSLNYQQLENLLKMLSPYAKYVKEYTIEVNPETIDEQKVSLLAKYGVNRISMGLQAIQPHLLKQMNRHHTLNQIQTSIALFKKYNIINISLDIIYSLPQQTIDDLQATLNYVCGLPITHLSIYSLTIEKNSVFGKKGYQHLDDELEADMYDLIINTLDNNNFIQYEISSFQKNNCYSRHNLAYWKYEDFYGIGLGASGKKLNKRYDNTRCLKTYLTNYNAKEIYSLDLADEIFEYLMMNLRLKEGLSLVEFYQKFKINFLSYYFKPVHVNIDRKLLMIKKGRLCATSRGYSILNTILMDFLPEN